MFPVPTRRHCLCDGAHMLVNSHGARAIGLYIVQHSLDEAPEFVQGSQHFRRGKQQTRWNLAAARCPPLPKARQLLQVRGISNLFGYLNETRHWEMLCPRLPQFCRWIPRVCHPLWHFHFKLRAVTVTFFAHGDCRTTWPSTWACDHRGALANRR